VHTHTLTNTNPDSHTHSLTDTHTRTHIHKHTYTNTHGSHTHVHTHTNTHTHTHTHTRSAPSRGQALPYARTPLDVPSTLPPRCVCVRVCVCVCVRVRACINTAYPAYMCLPPSCMGSLSQSPFFHNIKTTTITPFSRMSWCENL